MYCQFSRSLTVGLFVFNINSNLLYAQDQKSAKNSISREFLHAKYNITIMGIAESIQT